MTMKAREHAPDAPRPSRRELDEPVVRTRHARGAIDPAQLDRLLAPGTLYVGPGGQGAAGDVVHESPSQDQLATPVKRTEIDKTLDVVQYSFIWLNQAAEKAIERLRRHLKQEDQPDWFGHILEALLHVAIGAGAAGVGQFLASKLIDLGDPARIGVPAPTNKLEATHELVKSLFEGGIEAGVQAGISKLAGGKDDNVVDPFIDSQIQGAQAAQTANQNRFIMTEREKITTLERAGELMAACSPTNVQQAAEKQYEATRDAWVSYLAQTTFGARGKRGPVHKGDVDVGPTTTNMSTQESRDFTNRSAPGHVPEDAPEMGDALWGNVPGVLEVVVELPEINSSNEMDGKPKVKIALMNGVNETIRDQYQGHPLATMRIPRQVVAKVEGDLPDFTLNLDEAGTSTGPSLKQGAWLRARAAVGHPENLSKVDFDKQEAGVKLLLEELVPDTIRK